MADSADNESVTEEDGKRNGYLINSVKTIASI